MGDLADRDRHRGPVLVALLGGLLGAGVGLGVAAGLGAGADAVVRHPFQPPAVNWLLAGFVLGFLVVGLAVRNRTAFVLGAFTLRTMLLVVGGAIGVALAALAVAFTIADTQGGVGPALRTIFDTAGQPGQPATPFLAAGLVAGVAGTLMAVGRSVLRSGVRVVVGLVMGGLAGLLLYSVAWVLIHEPGLPDQPTYFLRYAEAIYSFTAAEGLFVAMGACCGAILSRYTWRIYGILTFVSLFSVVLGYILYTLTHTLPSVPADERVFSIFLFAAELLSLLMVLLYSFYTIDVAARKHWRRTTEEAPFSPYFLPKVAFHVPAFNEPPELLEGTLRTLLAVDYPKDRYVIMVADDSTRPECADPLRAFCEAHGIHYQHRSDRGGYKAGALNLLLRDTPQDVDLLAVVDADYQVQPEFLRETVGFFIDPDMGWLQTPQDYRNRHESFLTEQYYLADAYFYRTILPSRNEENSIIFCGTMGILRKRAVLEAGGWSETCITEDAELSARLLNTGWKSLYVNKTYGYGLIPTTFEAYKKQQYRWAFGGGRILRNHWHRFLFGRFSFRQRLDYLVGTFNWFEGAFIFLITCTVLAMGIGDILDLDIVTHHHNEILLVGLVPAFLLLDGLTRVHLVLRRAIALDFGGTLRILGMWFSVKFSNMRAAGKALIGFSIPFVRTPKGKEDRIGRVEAARRAIRLTRFESLMAIVLFCVAVGIVLRLVLEPSDRQARAFLTFWLLYYMLVYTAAPFYAYKSLSTVGRGKGGPPALAEPIAGPAPTSPPPSPRTMRIAADDPADKVVTP